MTAILAALSSQTGQPPPAPAADPAGLTDGSSFQDCLDLANAPQIPAPQIPAPAAPAPDGAGQPVVPDQPPTMQALKLASAPTEPALAAVTPSTDDIPTPDPLPEPKLEPQPKRKPALPQAGDVSVIAPPQPAPPPVVASSPQADRPAAVTEDAPRPVAPQVGAGPVPVLQPDPQILLPVAPEPAARPHLDLTAPPADWAAQAAHQAAAALAEGRHGLDLRIAPEHLGPLHLHLRVEGGLAHVEISAAQPETRQLLAEARPDLRQALSEHGLILAGPGHDLSGGASSQGGAPSQQPPARQTPSRGGALLRRGAAADGAPSRPAGHVNLIA